MEEYAFHEYPKTVYKTGKPDFIPGWVEPPPYLSKAVNSADEELEALDDGWLTCPPEEKKTKQAA